MSPERRANGALFWIADSKFRDSVEAEPICLLGIVSFENEMSQDDWASRNKDQSGIAVDNRPNYAALKVLEHPRNCPKWRRYRLGLSPGRFLEFIVMTDLERLRQRMVRNMERQRREFDKSLATTVNQERKRWSSELAKDRERFDKQQGKMQTRLAWLGVSVGLLAIGAITRDSIIWIGISAACRAIFGGE